MCRGVPMHIAADLWEVDSALCAEDGGVQIGGMRSCRPTQCLAENNIKPQDFTSQSGVSHTTPRKKER